MWEYVYQKIWQLSSLSSFDYIYIQASFYHLMDEKFRCEDKVREYAKRSNYEHAQMLVSKANGCDEISDTVKYQIDSIGYHSCFCNYKHPLFNSFLLLFKNYEKGVMPFEGPLSKQPAYIMEVFNILENLKADKEEENRKKDERRNKK